MADLIIIIIIIGARLAPFVDKSEKIDIFRLMLSVQINILINQVFLATVILRF